MSAPRTIKLASVSIRKKHTNIRSGDSDLGQAATRWIAATRGDTAKLPWRIEMVPLQHLKPAARNPKTHPEKQIELLVKNIRQFGFTNPALADENLILIGGHLRGEAAKRVGMTAIPVIIIAGLSEHEKRALALADNKIAERGGWLNSDLAQELNELAPLLEEAGLDFELTGFEERERDGLLRDFVDPEQEPDDDLPEPSSDTVSRLGDRWLLGPHRLECGDATKPRTVSGLMGLRRAGLLFTDRPYNVRIRDVQGRGKTKHREFMQASGEMSSDEYKQFLIESLTAAARHSTDGAIHYVCMDWRHGRELQDAGAQIYSELKNICIWVKATPAMGSFYRAQYECVYVFKAGRGRHLNNFELGQHGRNRSNVWTYAGVNSFRAGRMEDSSAHPTVKPVALVIDAIRDCSRRGDIVLDPFMGSGTTILAAERTGRRGYGLEIDPVYVDVAVRRWQNFTKSDAILEATGQTFGELAKERSRKPRGRT